ncbi:MAG: alpha/beta hydrolase [Solirubrobacteraceae bacterium]|nr:alpha/beta hydrolase [Solirubrobacteraceae bacterium]
MARTQYAEEIDRIVDGPGTFRTFGPASPRSSRASRNMRRSIYLIVATWRPTSRGIRIGRTAMERALYTRPMRGTRLERSTLGGVDVEWTVSKRAQGVPERTRVVLYLHGGGYVVGSPKTHRNLTSRISHVLSTPVASVDYRMAPEVGIRESFADAVAAYRGLLDEGYPPEGIIIAGDSAGGGLAAGVGLAVVDQGLPAPAGLVLLSPWLDLANAGGSHTANVLTEALIGGEVLNRISRALLPDEAARRDWHVSPFHAPSELLAQLPPTLVQVGGAEVLLDDGLEFARRIAMAGGTVELDRFEGQGHVVAMWTGLPEARRALKELAAWAKDVLPDHLEPVTPSAETIEEAVEHGGAAPGPEDLLG